MLRAGVVVLTIWGGINFLLAVAILAQVIFRGSYPSMAVVVFSNEELAALDPKVHAGPSA